VKLRLLAILAAATVGVGSAAAFAATMTVGSWHLWTGSQTLTKSTCTVTGAAATTDTYVDENQGGQANDTAVTMNVQPDAGARQWTFIRFNLASCAIPTTGGADTATLKLVIKTVPAGGRTLTLTPVLTTWAGATIDFTPALAYTYGPTTTTFATGTTNGATLSIPVTIDVDALIKSATANYGWRISDGGSTAAGHTSIFNSTDATTATLRPQLVINYEK
jgi:hypothetical protein